MNNILKSMRVLFMLLVISGYYCDLKVYLICYKKCLLKICFKQYIPKTMQCRFLGNILSNAIPTAVDIY